MIAECRVAANAALSMVRRKECRVLVCPDLVLECPEAQQISGELLTADTQRRRRVPALAPKTEEKALSHATPPQRRARVV
jgi:hypothetical protein